MIRGRGRDIVGRVAIAVAVLGSWLWHFGLLGSEFDADTSIATDMALRPIAATSLYVWGQNRQGMAIPILAHALHWLLGVPTHPTVQLLYYSVGALGLFVAMGLLQSWETRLLLAAVLAWPSAALALSLCNSYLLPLAFLLAVGQVVAFRAAVLDPTPWRLAWVGLLSGFLLYAAENCVVLFPAEVWILAVVLYRSKGGVLWRPAAAALGGLALPVAVIAYGKHTVRAPEVWGLISPARALGVAASLGPQLHDLVPALGGAGLYCLLLLAFVWAAIDLWSLRRRDLANVRALDLLGTAPLLGLIGTSFSLHFEQNLRLPRYLSWPVLVGLVAGGLMLDRIMARLGRPPWAQVGAWALALAVGVGCWLGRFSGHTTELEAHWRGELGVVEAAGCEGVIGNHWDVYPLMALSEGAVLASAIGPAPRIVNGSLALDTIRRPEVCRIRTGRPDPGPCQPSESYFGAGLRLRDEVRQKVDGQQIELCRYSPAPFAGLCARSADLPNTAAGPDDATVLPSAAGASGRVLELRNAVRFGPYTALEPGDYRFVTRLSATPGAAVTLDVFSGSGGGVLAKRSLTADQFPAPGTWRVFSLPFTVSTGGVGDLELRTAVRGGAAVREDWIGVFEAAEGPAEGSDLQEPPCGGTHDDR